MAGKKRKISYDSDRMKTAIRKAGFTQEKLMEKLGILSLVTFNQCQSEGKILPEHLRTICKEINANPDYIAGLSDYPLALSFAQDETKEVDRFARIELPVHVDNTLTAKANIYDINIAMLREHGLNTEILKSIKKNPHSDLEYWSFKFMDYALTIAIESIENNLKYFDESGMITGGSSNFDIKPDWDKLRSELKSYSKEFKKLFEEGKEVKENDDIPQRNDQTKP